MNWDGSLNGSGEESILNKNCMGKGQGKAWELRANLKVRKNWEMNTIAQRLFKNNYYNILVVQKK